MLQTRTARRLLRDDRGAALIELAVVIPLITVLGLGVLEFANYFYNFQLIQSGVRDAARYAASLPYDSSNTSRHDSQIKNMAVAGVPTGGNRRLPFWDISKVAVTWGTVSNPMLTGGVQSYRYNGDVPVVTVSTSVSYPSLGFLGFLQLGSLKLAASHKERVFGVR